MTSLSSGMTADTPATLEQQAVRKAAWRFIPLLALAYFFNYLDRTSVGFAALTMNRDLGLTATQFGWGAGIMFAGYCICEVPSNLALYRFGGEGRFRHETELPLLAPAVARQRPAVSALEQRQRAQVESGNLWESARELARRRAAGLGHR